MVLYNFTSKENCRKKKPEVIDVERCTITFKDNYIDEIFAERDICNTI